VFTPRASSAAAAAGGGGSAPSPAEKSASGGREAAEVAALPQSQQGDRPAFLAALRYMTDKVRGDDERALPIARKWSACLPVKRGSAADLPSGPSL